MIKYNHYPKRWLNVVDVMLEKGKRLRLKKLRMLEMIEAGFQLVMIMHLVSRINERVEPDDRI